MWQNILLMIAFTVTVNANPIPDENNCDTHQKLKFIDKPESRAKTDEARMPLPVVTLPALMTDITEAPVDKKDLSTTTETTEIETSKPTFALSPVLISPELGKNLLELNGDSPITTIITLKTNGPIDEIQNKAPVATPMTTIEPKIEQDPMTEILIATITETTVPVVILIAQEPNESTSTTPKQPELTNGTDVTATSVEKVIVEDHSNSLKDLSKANDVVLKTTLVVEEDLIKSMVNSENMNTTMQSNQAVTDDHQTKMTSSLPLVDATTHATLTVFEEIDLIATKLPTMLGFNFNHEESTTDPSINDLHPKATPMSDLATATENDELIITNESIMVSEPAITLNEFGSAKDIPTTRYNDNTKKPLSDEKKIENVISSEKTVAIVDELTTTIKSTVVPATEGNDGSSSATFVPEIARKESVETSTFKSIVTTVEDAITTMKPESDEIKGITSSERITDKNDEFSTTIKSP
jgi:hypothetical protein